jgi:hypothetical protein
MRQIFLIFVKNDKVNTIQILVTIAIFILLAWDIYLHIRLRRNKNRDHEHHELNSKLNFITASGSFAILAISFLGWDVKDEILKKSEEPIKEMINKKSAEIDTLLKNKNILKAGIYIVTDLEFKENKIFKFQDLLTIDHKHLPELTNAPKLLINTRTGENLRIEKVTNEYFILGKPISETYSIYEEGVNPKYPKVLKFDIWIADYKQE